MTPAQFREARLKLGLSIRRCAADLGRAPRSIQRWESGELPVPTAEALLMAWLAFDVKPDIPSPLPKNRPRSAQRE